MVDSLEQQLAALKQALGSGVLRVSYGDKSSEFRTLKEIREAIAILERQLAATPPVRNLVIRPAQNKGW